MLLMRMMYAHSMELPDNIFVCAYGTLHPLNGREKPFCK